MAGDAIVLLEYFRAVSLHVVHRRQVRGLGALGVHVTAIEDESDAQNAKYSSIVDSPDSPKPVIAGAVVYVKCIETGSQYFFKMAYFSTIFLCFLHSMK